jgi:HEAT repeat protein
MALWKVAGRTEGATVLSEAIHPPRLDDPSWHERLAALGEMGPAAKETVANLERLCSWGNQEIREPALAALQEIDPEAAAKVRPLP